MQKFGNFKIENTIPNDLKLCHIAIIIQNLLYQNIKRERKSRTEQRGQKIKPKSYSQLIFEQCTKMQNWGNNSHSDT